MERRGEKKKERKRKTKPRGCGYLTLSDKRNKAKGVIAVEIDFSVFSLLLKNNAILVSLNASPRPLRSPLAIMFITRSNTRASFSPVVCLIFLINRRVDAGSKFTVRRCYTMRRTDRNRYTIIPHISSSSSPLRGGIGKR